MTAPRITAHAVLLCAAVVVVAAAREARAADATPGVSAGRDAVPARIVSLAPSVTETLFALGAGPRVVAVSDFCDYPPEVLALPKIGSFVMPSVEAIIAQHPDVVIGAPSPGNHEAVLALRRLGIRVEAPDPEHLQGLPDAIRVIATAGGVPAAGERLVTEIERGMNAVRARVAALPPRRVLMAIGRDPLVAVGPGSFLGELLVEARAINVAPAGPWPHVNVEYIVAQDPEVIIDSSMGTEQNAAAGFWERLPSLAAVRTGRVHAFRSLRVLRPGPRLPQAFEDLARLIHPEAWR
jgi:iron complex transport system substrate-binding protein